MYAYIYMCMYKALVTATYIDPQETPFLPSLHSLAMRGVRRRNSHGGLGWKCRTLPCSRALPRALDWIADKALEPTTIMEPYTRIEVPRFKFLHSNSEDLRDVVQCLLKFAVSCAFG